jgi:hypothetical protein
MSNSIIPKWAKYKILVIQKSSPIGPFLKDIKFFESEEQCNLWAENIPAKSSLRYDFDKFDFHKVGL